MDAVCPCVRRGRGSTGSPRTAHRRVTTNGEGSPRARQAHHERGRLTTNGERALRLATNGRLTADGEGLPRTGKGPADGEGSPRTGNGPFALRRNGCRSPVEGRLPAAPVGSCLRGDDGGGHGRRLPLCQTRAWFDRLTTNGEGSPRAWFDRLTADGEGLPRTGKGPADGEGSPRTGNGPFALRRNGCRSPVEGRFPAAPGGSCLRGDDGGGHGRRLPLCPSRAWFDRLTTNGSPQAHHERLTTGSPRTAHHRLTTNGSPQAHHERGRLPRAWFDRLTTNGERVTTNGEGSRGCGSTGSPRTGKAYHERGRVPRTGKGPADGLGEGTPLVRLSLATRRGYNGATP